jgi:hypothetical protein
LFQVCGCRDYRQNPGLVNGRARNVPTARAALEVFKPVDAERLTAVIGAIGR